MLVLAPSNHVMVACHVRFILSFLQSSAPTPPTTPVRADSNLQVAATPRHSKGHALEFVALATLAASLQHAQDPTRGPQTTSAKQVGLHAYVYACVP
jgi:hypothetical protein